MSEINISISIVCFNNEKIIKETLESLVKYHKYGPVYLIDNDSTDGTLEVLKGYAQKHSMFQVLSGHGNIGFGKGHNLILDKIDSRYHIYLNPDIRITEDLFMKLADFMNSHSDVGLVVPKLLHEDGSLQPINQRLVTVYDMFLRRFWPGFLNFLVQKRLDWYCMLDKGYDHIYDVPSVTGCFMFCRTSVLKKIRGFDPRYFIYFEDKDLGLKVRAEGYKTQFYPFVSAIHLWQRATHKKWKMVWVHIQNGCRYFNKWGWKFF